MACENLACIGGNGCLEEIPNAPVGRIMTIGPLGTPVWASPSVLLDPSTANCLEQTASGLLVLCTTPIQGHGYVTDTGPGPYAAPAVGPDPAVFNIQSVFVTILNPTSLRTAYFMLNAHQSMYSISLSGTAPNVNMLFELHVNGGFNQRSGERNEAHSGGTQFGFAGGVSYANSIAPGGSMSLEIRNILQVYSGTVNSIAVSRISYAWQGFLIKV